MRKLAGHAKRIRQIADLHRLAEGHTIPDAVHQVADNRLAAHDRGIGLGIPGADNQLSTLDKRLHARAVFGHNGKIILQNSRLSIENIVFVLIILLQPGQDFFHIIDQKNTRLFGGEVPLTVPVHMRRDMNARYSFHLRFLFVRFYDKASSVT